MGGQDPVVKLESGHNLGEGRNLGKELSSLTARLRLQDCSTIVLKNKIGAVL